MKVCDNCGLAVESRWKFCLTCGQKMAAAVTVDDSANYSADDSADDSAVQVEPRRLHFDWQLTLAVILAVAGLAVIIYLVVVLVLPHD